MSTFAIEDCIFRNQFFIRFYLRKLEKSDCLYYFKSYEKGLFGVATILFLAGLALLKESLRIDYVARS